MKIALCNEVLQPLPFEQQCTLAADLGYDGLEVAPFTLADDPLRIDDKQAAAYGRIARDHGLAITGLHWLLVAPAGLSIVSEDVSLRNRTSAVMERLVDLCAAMGGKYLVHGSPKQRSVPAGTSATQAWDRARECLARAAARAQACGVTYCIEPLSTRETDLLNTVEDGVRMVREIGSPGFKTMIHCSAAASAHCRSNGSGCSTSLQRPIFMGNDDLSMVRRRNDSLSCPRRRGPKASIAIADQSLGFPPSRE